MATIKRFEDLEVWQIARQQSQAIWNISNHGTFSDDWGLKNQINKTTGSVMDNIAEGFGRGGNREFVNFLSIARGSNDEVRSQLFRAYDREHISKDTFEELFEACDRLGRKIHNFIEYLKKSDFRGQKFIIGVIPEQHQTIPNNTEQAQTIIKQPQTK